MLAHADRPRAGSLAAAPFRESRMTAARETAMHSILRRLEAGERDARAELIALFYEDLRGRARKLLRGRGNPLTLQTTALANEACVRLLSSRAAWGDRDHFLSAAARAMRSVLVDRARAHKRLKRSPHGERVPLDEVLQVYQERGVDVGRLDEAIERLAGFDPEMARAVELSFFAALDVAETARMLGMARRTFDRRWAATRAWLRSALEA